MTYAKLNEFIWGEMCALRKFERENVLMFSEEEPADEKYGRHLSPEDDIFIQQEEE